MENPNDATPANPMTTQLAQNQLPTFVTQTSSSSVNESLPTAAEINEHHRTEGIQHATSSSAGRPIVVVHPNAPSAVGLVPSSGPVNHGPVAGAAVQASGDQQQMGGLYTTSTGLPAEYVIPGANMLPGGGQGFQVHVPVMQHQESGSEGMRCKYLEFLFDSQICLLKRGFHMIARITRISDLCWLPLKQGLDRFRQRELT